MAKKYTKKTRRSRRKDPRKLRGKILRKDEAAVQLSLPIAEIIAGVNHAVEAVAAEAGLLVMKALIEEEVEQRAGLRYRHDPERSAVRWGKEDGYVVFAGRKVPVLRPRLRGTSGQEVPLERYQLFQDDGRMQEAVSRHILARVSTRNYQGVLEDVCDGYGIQKSSVSRHWKVASQEELRKLMDRPLGDLNLSVMMIDGIDFREFLLVVALGITSSGKKYVLGLWQGATENTQVCKTLLEDLTERGLSTDRKYLFVLDGSKALRKAVRLVFGDKAPVQRCQFHKERNVLSHLPDSCHVLVRSRLRAAWNMKSYEDAKQALLKLVKYLEGINPSAAASLREGLEETLTLQRLGIPEKLWRTLRSTNPIESCLSRMSDLCRNVKNWKNANMAWRWAGTMLLEAEKRFRRILGYRELPLLVSSLKKGVAIKKRIA